jgi:hypothetical protein
MPRRNRVTPRGELIAVPDRGLFWGNRGRLHNPAGEVVRYSTTKAWAICVLEFKGRRRQQWAPGRLTELYFLDEATALAAGHRPCGECRYHDYQAFKAAYGRAHPDDEPTVHAIDARMHADRLSGPRIRRTHTARLGDLPAGTMIELAGVPWLIWRDELLAWHPGGYTDRQPRRLDGEVTVLTPLATVATLAAGYEPVVHPTADVGDIEGR